MSAVLAITRKDHTAPELRALSSKCADSAQVRRILAISFVLDGRSRSEAASLTVMERQTLRDWVHRYNADGIEGLKSRKSPGREPYLSEQQKAELRELVIKGPVRRSTRSSAGVAWICKPRCSAGGRSRCMRARSASGSANSA